MAGFKTHITTSTVLGIAGAAAGAAIYDVPLPTAILAGGLCSVSGMLPDLDSASGVPKRESIAFAAAVIPMLLAERFKRLGMEPEYIVLTGGFIYLFIRFLLPKVLTKWSVHRGMFHSLPACLIAGEVAFLLAAHEDIRERYLFGGAVMTGFMSHLILDEIWSLDFHGGRLRFKSSFGTAMKFWGETLWSNLLTYSLLAALTFADLEDPSLMQRLTSPDGAPQVAGQDDDGRMAKQPVRRMFQQLQ